MSITAKELAKQLNLSATAVSMALNNKPGVSTQTKNRIIRAAEEAGYNFSRLALKNRGPSNVYCMIYRAHNAILNYSPIFSELTDSIEHELRLNEFQMTIVQVSENSDDIQRYLSDIRLSNCAGIILLGTETDMRICEEFMHLNLPIILLDSCFDLLDISSVSINNVQGAYLAAKFLIDNYKCRPGYLRSSYRIPNFDNRRTGFEKALKEYGMSAAGYSSYEIPPSINGAISEMLGIINGGGKLERCYFADNDLIAIGAIKALLSAGIRVPEDVAIAGFDNILESQIVEPALTTIDVSRRYMGQTAARQLVYQIKNRLPHTLKIEVPTKLIKRATA